MIRAGFWFKSLFFLRRFALRLCSLRIVLERRASGMILNSEGESRDCCCDSCSESEPYFFWEFFCGIEQPFQELWPFDEQLKLFSHFLSLPALLKFFQKNSFFRSKKWLFHRSSSLSARKFDMLRSLKLSDFSSYLSVNIFNIQYSYIMFLFFLRPPSEGFYWRAGGWHTPAPSRSFTFFYDLCKW